jgi:hypothetical protein
MVSRIREVMMKRIWRIPLFVLLIIILGVSIVAGVIAIVPKSTVQDLRFEVWTDKNTYGINETIIIHLKIVNPTFSQVCLNFSSAYQFDYIIFDQANNQLYRWASDKEFLAVLTKICVGPLSSHKRTVSHAPKYYLLQPGIYTIRGVVDGYFLKDTTIEVLET